MFYHYDYIMCSSIISETNRHIEGKEAFHEVLIN